jgi:hypothetical protein
MKTTHLPKDLSGRVGKMPRGSTILYINQSPHGDDPSHWRGVIRLLDGSLHWVGVWERTLGNREVLEVRLQPKVEN